MPSISANPDFVPEFKPPPGVTAQNLIRDISWHLIMPLPHVVTNVVQDVFAFTFYRHAFGVELSTEELALMKEWLGIPTKLLVGFQSESGGRRCREIAKVFEEKVAAGEIGQNLIQEAEQRGWITFGSHSLCSCKVQRFRGMNGMDRVRKVVYEFNFAGLGGDGPGGGLATMKMLRQIQRAPEKMVPLFKKNPEAFIMEVIRTQGGGGAGVGPWVVQKTRNHTLGTGKVLTEYAGNLP
eukprot:g32893.t1